MFVAGQTLLAGMCGRRPDRRRSRPDRDAGLRRGPADEEARAGGHPRARLPRPEGRFGAVGLGVEHDRQHRHQTVLNVALLCEL